MMSSLRKSASARRTACLLAVALACGLGGCAGSPFGGMEAGSGAASGGSDDLARSAAPFLASSERNSGAYQIGAQDVLDITVFKVPDLSRTVQVSDNGRITYPLVGEVSVAGRTPQDVERSLASSLGGRYLQSPQVSVFVKEYNSQRVTVEGAVKKPGVFALKGRSTLLQAIAMAEGLDRDTAESTAVIFRKTGEGRSAARFDLDDIRNGRSTDPALVQGDTIVVGTSNAKVAFGYLVKALPVATLFRPF